MNDDISDVRFTFIVSSVFGMMRPINHITLVFSLKQTTVLTHYHMMNHTKDIFKKGSGRQEIIQSIGVALIFAPVFF